MALGQFQLPEDVYKSHSQTTPLIFSNEVLESLNNLKTHSFETLF